MEPKSFYTLIKQIIHECKHFSKEKLREIKLSPGQPKILIYLLHHNGCTQKKVSDYCGIEPATTSRIIDSMESNKLVTRSTSETCRRSFSIKLTELGRQKAEQIELTMRDMDKNMFDGFTEKDRERILEDMCRIRENLIKVKQNK